MTDGLWRKNLELLNSGALGDNTSPKTLLKYWKMQAAAGYPQAEENVKYFEYLTDEVQINFFRNFLLTNSESRDIVIAEASGAALKAHAEGEIDMLIKAIKIKNFTSYRTELFGRSLIMSKKAIERYNLGSIPAGAEKALKIPESDLLLVVKTVTKGEEVYTDFYLTVRPDKEDDLPY